MSEPGNSLIKTPRQLITVILLAFVVPVVAIILLATYVVTSATGGAGSDAYTEAAISARMQPVGVVEFAATGAARALQTGEAVYAAACGACHAAGVAGAPRTGDTAAWAPRIKQGLDVLVKHSVQGIRAMPAKGGNPNLDPIEVARAVVLMANQSGAKFKEPAAPAAATAAPSAPSATGAVPTGPAPQAAIAPAPAAMAQAPAPAAIAAVPAGVPVAAAKGAAVAVKADGAKIYASGCNACHVAGVAGAPKLGDKTAWAPRLGLGIDALTASVIKGKGVMPARGAVAGASDAELRAAVEYMVSSVK